MSSHIVPRVDGLIYGGDYNPEQWPEEIWIEDAALMKAAGVNLVSVGIFSWATLEPEPGSYRFDWLDRVLELLNEAGVRVNLATPTASPPAWLAANHPESLPVDEQGRRLKPGSRQHYCPSSAAYRKAAAAITTAMAKRYGRHPALASWHINNEYACHVNACYCEVCRASFQKWLQKRYRTLDVLNDAWGAAFWSQRYSDWNQIHIPNLTPTTPNPCQALDFKRFTNDNILDLYLAERAILRKATPKIPVSTNFMGLFRPLDYFQWAEQSDYVSWDSYPDPADGLVSVCTNAMLHDLTRSLKPGRPFVLMEQVTTQVNWRTTNALRKPGQMRSMSYQAIARGADGVMFFQWRAGRSGAEKYHGAMVPHVPHTQSRVYAEVCTLGQELARLAPVRGSTIEPKLAVLLDWPSMWALELPGKPQRFDMLGELLRYYRPLYELNIPTAFVRPEDDPSNYRVILAPLAYMLTEKAAENLRKAVQSGATLIMTYFSGVVDEADRIRLGGYPALLRDVLGLWVEEWDALPPGRSNAVRFPDHPGAVNCEHICEIVHLEQAQPVGAYMHDFYAGRPAVTRNTFGRGEAWYLATAMATEWLSTFLLERCTNAGAGPILRTPRGVEASLRSADDQKTLFIINQMPTPNRVRLESIWGTDLLTGAAVRDAVELPAFGVLAMSVSGGLPA